jgi:hypothetical protein
MSLNITGKPLRILLNFRDKNAAAVTDHLGYRSQSARTETTNLSTTMRATALASCRPSRSENANRTS